MIPSFEETIAKIEAEFPRMGWLLRSNQDERGKYFFHLHSEEFNRLTWSYESSFRFFGDTKDIVAFEAYCAAVAAKAVGIH